MKNKILSWSLIGYGFSYLILLFLVKLFLSGDNAKGWVFLSFYFIIPLLVLFSSFVCGLIKGIKFIYMLFFIWVLPMIFIWIITNTFIIFFATVYLIISFVGFGFGIIAIKSKNK